MWRSGPFAAILAAVATVATGAHAQELTRLYAPKPPAGSAYVRVVDLSRSGALIGFDAGSGIAAAQGEPATIYRIVKGGTPLNLTLSGKPVKGTVTPPADAFSTVIIGAGGNAVLIPDSVEGRNDLKAQLRFYNLVPGCAGAVAVVDGPAVFEGVATNETRQRAINPIEATLAGRCGEMKTESLKLPPLKAGDHFSLFLVPGPSGVVLAGQRDETEPYRGPN
ncbi:MULTISPECIES: alginate O-acetyltransferase AlgF [unclassified Xanthobacter]|uniref:alginate O-acetyltransferase AlgF n=1 Tax=unclassified Xanthobacter TaxID=2623496 RepID=UPI001F3F0AE5|nr:MULTISPECIES: alginate O-acetyltransferase AlgF [unclassified Xanthobacter]